MHKYKNIHKYICIHISTQQCSTSTYTHHTITPSQNTPSHTPLVRNVLSPVLFVSLLHTLSMLLTAGQEEAHPHTVHPVYGRKENTVGVEGYLCVCMAVHVVRQGYTNNNNYKGLAHETHTLYTHTIHTLYTHTITHNTHTLYTHYTHTH